MGPDGVVLPAPLLDEHLRLPKCEEEFALEHLLGERSVETLVVAVLPGATRGNVEVFTPRLPSHFLTVLAVNSLPLSERM